MEWKFEIFYNLQDKIKSHKIILKIWNIKRKSLLEFWNLHKFDVSYNRIQLCMRIGIPAYLHRVINDKLYIFDWILWTQKNIVIRPVHFLNFKIWLRNTIPVISTSRFWAMLLDPKHSCCTILNSCCSQIIAKTKEFCKCNSRNLYVEYIQTTNELFWL